MYHVVGNLWVMVDGRYPVECLLTVVVESSDCVHGCEVQPGRAILR